jgi:hypothetical protein
MESVLPALHLSFRQRDETPAAPTLKREGLDHERGLDRHHAPLLLSGIARTSGLG